eukprot:scaffold104102_cov55-Attheya_sp.AAC.2
MLFEDGNFIKNIFNFVSEIFKEAGDEIMASSVNFLCSAVMPSFSWNHRLGEDDDETWSLYLLTSLLQSN